MSALTELATEMDHPVSAVIFEKECRRLIAASEQRDLRMRLIGGLAVWVHCPNRPSGRERDYGDVDVITTSKLRELAPVFEELHYEPYARFNAMHGATRAIFYGAEGLKVDLFIGTFNMCHELPLAERLEVDKPTVPLAELCLTKLQIVQLNEKDLIDLFALLAEHPVGDADRETINGKRFAELCSRDWGLHHTIELNLHRMQAELTNSNLNDDDRAAAGPRIDDLLARMAAHDKSRRWKIRARVGERVQWYEEPDAVVDAH